MVSYETSKDYEVFKDGKPFLQVLHKFFTIKNGKQLYVVICKLVEINPSLEYIDVLDISRFIANSANGISAFSFSDKIVEDISEKAYNDVKNNVIDVSMKKRKVFFGENCRLTPKGKKVISGRLSTTSRRVEKEHLWGAINDMKLRDMLIDNKRLSMFCNCSTKTISRRFTPAMKREISHHNKKMRIKYNRRH